MWPADGPSGYGEMARGGCLFAWNFSVTRSAVPTGGVEKPLDQTCRYISDSLPAYRLEIPPAKNRALYCAVLECVLGKSLDWSWRSPCLVTPFAGPDASGLLLVGIHAFVRGVSGEVAAKCACFKTACAEGCYD